MFYNVNTIIQEVATMPSVQSLTKDAKKLTDREIEVLFANIGELLSLNSISNTIYSDSREKRYSGGVVCIHCESNKVIKHGKKNSVQRFKCKNCGKTFNDITLTPMAKSHLPINKWLEYAKCMILGFSIRKSATACEVSVKTSFYMRHRLLDAIRDLQGIGEVSGVVEMDETFLPESFKGNHKKSGFKMPRTSRKRGKEIKVRGISHEQVCIATAIDRNNNIVFEMVTKGRIKTSDLDRLFKNRIDPDSVICTDSHKSYIKFAHDNVAEHIKIARGKHKNGIYHISHVNSLHSKFKKWIKPFNGVATKYLANYLHWFKWLQTFSDEKDVIKAKHLLINASTKLTDTRLEHYKTRKPLYV